MDSYFIGDTSSYSGTEGSLLGAGTGANSNGDILSAAMDSIVHRLASFAKAPAAEQQLSAIFDHPNSPAVQTLLEDWSSQTSLKFPRVNFLDALSLAGANGAYVEQNDAIYVSTSLLKPDFLTGLERVILEEYGHSLDAHLNPGQDTPGDEGERFALTILGQHLTESDLLRLRHEQDFSTIFVDGQPTTAELSTSSLEFNGDYHPDIVWRDSASGQNVVWFMGGTNNTQITGSNSLTTVGGSWDIKGIADFNGDNRPDLLWRDSASGQNVVWFMGGTNNTQIMGSNSLTTVGGSWDIKGIADFNGDNRPDLLWRDSASGQNVVWFMGGTNNTQIMGSNSLTTVGGSWDIKGIADFNGDNRPDLLWRDSTSGQNVVWFMGGTNNTQIMGSNSLTTVGGSWDIKGIADFNGDNRPDLLWRDPNSGQNVLWFMGGTNNANMIGYDYLTTVTGSWKPILMSWQKSSAQADLVVQGPTAPTSVTVGNTMSLSAYVKNQGTLSAEASTLRYYLSNNTTLDSSDIYLGHDSVSSLASGASGYETASFTYNSSWGTGTKYVLFVADATGTVAESNESNNVAYKAITVTSDIKSNDFNGDGKADILWRNYANGMNSVWLMNGTKRVSDVFLDAVNGQNWQIEGTGDFNNDGKTDILWRNHANGMNSVWLMNGTKRVSDVFLDAVNDQNWQIEGTGDFNNDGKTDILWRNHANGMNSVWLMNGTKRVSDVFLDAVNDQNWQIEGTGDFNNDGKTDILWRNHANGMNSVWLMNGTKRVSDVFLDAVNDQNWQIEGTGDFNNDGKTDILWRNHANGMNSVWLMNGTKRVSDVFLDAVNDQNWQIEDKSIGRTASLSYYPELSSLTESQWDYYSGDNTRIWGKVYDGEVDERANTPDEVEAIYKDLSNSVVGSVYAMTAGYIDDSSYLGLGEGHHTGIDIGASAFTPVYALDSGVILKIENFGSRGYFIHVKSESGIWVYGHVDNSLNLSKGQQITKGQKISRVGNITAFGPHLHLEFRTQDTGTYKQSPDFLRQVTNGPIYEYWKLRNS